MALDFRVACVLESTISIQQQQEGETALRRTYVVLSLLLIIFEVTRNDALFVR